MNQIQLLPVDAKKVNTSISQKGRAHDKLLIKEKAQEINLMWLGFWESSSCYQAAGELCVQSNFFLSVIFLFPLRVSGKFLAVKVNEACLSWEKKEAEQWWFDFLREIFFSGPQKNASINGKKWFKLLFAFFMLTFTNKLLCGRGEGNVQTKYDTLSLKKLFLRVPTFQMHYEIHVLVYLSL